MCSHLVKKSTAGFLLFSLLFAMDILLLPLPAAPVRDEIPVATRDHTQGGILEVEGKSVSEVPAKKSPLLPILAGVAAAGIITAVLVFVVFKKSYDITGHWRLTIEYNGNPTSYNFVFAGAKKTGTLDIQLGSLSLGIGTYQVDGKNVTITIDWNGPDVANLQGVFTDADHLEGTYTETPNYSGRWYASRINAETAKCEEPAMGDHATRY